MVREERKQNEITFKTSNKITKNTDVIGKKNMRRKKKKR